jgi:uncharacterized protein (TIGR04255 family)
MSQKPRFTIDLDEKFPRLATAPITEAMVHWQAQATVPLGNSLQQQLQEYLPDYPHYESIQEFTVELGAVDGTSAEVRQQTQWQGLKLRNAENTYVAQFTSQGVIFSRLAPYEQWSSFQAEAMRFWNAFLRIAQPLAIQRLGVRYINRIPLDRDEQPSKYIKHIQPHIPQLDFPIEMFFYQDVYSIPGYPYLANWICTREPPSPTAPQGALILDIDVFNSEPFLPDQGRLEQRLQEMRWLKDKIFFSCITETAKAEFGG